VAALADPLIARIRRLLSGRTAPLVVALDGRSGARKSTLARDFAKVVDGVVIEGDDLILP